MALCLARLPHQHRSLLLPIRQYGIRLAASSLMGAGRLAGKQQADDKKPD